MSAETWKLEKDLCRCCHAEGAFQNMSEPCYESGQEEIYSDILKSCLGIELNPVQGLLYAMTYTICGACVLRLRDAHYFKQQVLCCEERFRNMYRNIKVVSPELEINEVKQEASLFVADVKVELEDMEGESDAGFDVPIGDSDDEDNNPILRTLLKKKMKAKAKTKTKTKPKAKKKTKKQTARKAEAVAEAVAGSQSEAAAEADADYEDTEGILIKPLGFTDKEFFTLSQAEDGSKIFTCNACFKTFKQINNVSEHFRHAHINLGDYYSIEQSPIDGTDQFICKICVKPFKKLMYFRQHYKVVHLHMKAGNCHLCHIKIESDLRAAHLEEEHGIPAPFCGICGKKFAYPSQVLRHHKIIHMGETYFECETCHRRFPTKDRLKRHEVKHSNVKSFFCNYCEKSFKWKKCLMSHIQIHLDVRRYVCQICQESFVHCTSLRYHMNKKHPNEAVQRNPPIQLS